MDTHADSAEECRIVVSRDSTRDLKIRSVEILVDGEYVANLAFGESCEKAVSPGPHTVTATNRAFSRSLDVDLSSGESTRFVAIGKRLRGFWTLLSMLGTVPYGIALEEAPEKLV